MRDLGIDSPQLISNRQSVDGQFNTQFEGSISAEFLTVPDASSSSLPNIVNIPKPPPLPKKSYQNASITRKVKGYNCISNETRHAWDRLFYEGYEADMRIHTDGKGLILAHSNVLGTSSSVLRNRLEQAKVKRGFRRIKIHGVPAEAARAFIRFLYSSWYDPEDMEKFVLHLLVMSHSFVIPTLKRVCVSELEQGLLTTDNVVDVLQLARQCDAPRLSMMSTSLIIKNFKTVSVSEGWKVMKYANPTLEQELLMSLVEADSRKQEKLKRVEDNKVYMQLYEAMEALLHICKDGCRTIGPRDKMLTDNPANCGYSACKVIESLVRHFKSCTARVTQSGCQHCKRMWQLLELHSCMCSESDSCKVPLCRHFKENKVRRQKKKEEVNWKPLVGKVLAAKGTISSISAWRSTGYIA